MRKLRPFWGSTIVLLLVALVAWGCSSSDDQPAASQPATAAQQPVLATDFQISSSEFTEVRPRTRIPAKYTCVADDLSPPLEWGGAPAGTESFALLIDDEDNKIGLFSHWVLFNIPADATGLKEGVPTTTDTLPDGSKQGTNDFKRMGYAGPCPPPNVLADLYRYYQGKPDTLHFKLYALDAMVDLAAGASNNELLDAMEGHILAQTEILGKYLRPKQQGWYLSDSNTAIPNTPTPVRTPFVPPTATSR